MADPRIQRLAQVLVDYSIDAQPGQRIGILGQTPAAPLIEAVFERVLARGAHPHPLVALPGLDALFLRRANDAQLAYVSPFTQTPHGGGCFTACCGGLSMTIACSFSASSIRM